jgi:thioredoxin 1
MITVRIVILALVCVGIAGALVLRHRRLAPPTETVAVLDTAARLVELGSTSCHSCKAMHEELARLREECGQSIAVEEVDVWQDENASRRYGVSVIPTQVFFDPKGRELDRHVGFLDRTDIRARFSEHGLECRR